MATPRKGATIVALTVSGYDAKMLTGEAAIFYENHRGGQGAVILAIAVDTLTHAERHGIFGSIEMAQSWSDSLGDEYVCVYSPYIVDDPDWGNEALAR